MVTTEVRDASDVRYLLRELELLQSAAHRIIAFLDQGEVENPRQ